MLPTNNINTLHAGHGSSPDMHFMFHLCKFGNFDSNPLW